MRAVVKAPKLPRNLPFLFLDYYAPTSVGREHNKNDGRCLSVRPSVACFYLTQERKGLEISQIGRMEAITQVTREPI